MDSEQLDAGEKFWKTPELGERLLSMLDPLSTRHLIQSGVMDKKILQKSLSLKAWSELIRRSSYGGKGLLQMEVASSDMCCCHPTCCKSECVYIFLEWCINK